MISGDDALYALLTKSFSRRPEPSPTFLPAQDFESLDDLPIVLFAAIGGTQVGGQEPPIMWDYFTSFTVMADTYRGAQELSIALYEVLHRWNKPGWGSDPLNVTDNFQVAQVRDQSVFSRATPYQMEGRQVLEMSGGFTMQLGHRVK